MQYHKWPKVSSCDTVPGPWSQNTGSTRLRVRERLMAVACSPALANNSLGLQSSLRQKHEAGDAYFSCSAERGLRVPVHTEDPSDSERRGVTRDTRRRTVLALREKEKLLQRDNGLPCGCKTGVSNDA